MDLLDAVAHRGHRLGQAGLHAAHGRIQHADLVVATQRDRAGQVAVGDAVEMRAGLVQRAQDAAPERQPDQHGQQHHQPQHHRRHQDDPGQGIAGAGHRRLAALAGIGLVGLGLPDVGAAAARQHLVDQAIHLDAVPALYRLLHGRQGLVGEGRIGGQHLVEQRRALRAGVRIGAQPRQAVGGLLEQGLGLLERGIARLFQPAFHRRLGIGQRRARWNNRLVMSARSLARSMLPLPSASISARLSRSTAMPAAAPRTAPRTRPGSPTRPW